MLQLSSIYSFFYLLINLSADIEKAVLRQDSNTWKILLRSVFCKSKERKSQEFSRFRLLLYLAEYACSTQPQDVKRIGEEKHIPIQSQIVDLINFLIQR